MSLFIGRIPKGCVSSPSLSPVSTLGFTHAPFSPLCICHLLSPAPRPIIAGNHLLSLAPVLRLRSALSSPGHENLHSRFLFLLCLQNRSSQSANNSSMYLIPYGVYSSSLSNVAGFVCRSSASSPRRRLLRPATGRSFSAAYPVVRCPCNPLYHCHYSRRLSSLSLCASVIAIQSSVAAARTATCFRTTAITHHRIPVDCDPSASSPLPCRCSQAVVEPPPPAVVVAA